MTARRSPPDAAPQARPRCRAYQDGCPKRELCWPERRCLDGQREAPFSILDMSIGEILAYSPPAAPRPAPDDNAPGEDAAYQLAERLAGLVVTVHDGFEMDIERAAEMIRATFTPGMTDLMVPPESIDAFMEKHPLPDENILPMKRWRHKVRGTIYTEIGRAELQMSRDLVEGATLVIYRGEDGKLWARQEDEFEDGRFVAIETAKERG